MKTNHALADASSLVVADRRQAPRLKLTGELNGGLLPFAEPLTVLDVSAGGFAVEAPIAFVPGGHYLFEFSAAGRKHRPLRAMSVHCLRLCQGDDTVYVAGFKFVVSDSTDRETIDAMLRQVRALLGV
jgi:hypothetical protein